MTTRISIELVPRTLEAVTQDLKCLQSRFSSIDTVNIPDLLRFDTRSWEACIQAKQTHAHAIPHLRAMDFDLSKGFPLAQTLIEHGIDELLLVTGDMPQDMGKRVYDTNVLKFIHKIKSDYPQFKVYAAIDSYRSGIRQELQYIQQKREAGADGFFTQPFFDLRLLQIYAEQLPDDEIFWGISPVVSEGSKNYWESKNHVVFPRDFDPSLAWNTAFANQVLQLVRQRKNNHAYFMPIRLDLEQYLSNIEL